MRYRCQDAPAIKTRKPFRTPRTHNDPSLNNKRRVYCKQPQTNKGKPTGMVPEHTHLLQHLVDVNLVRLHALLRLFLLALALGIRLDLLLRLLHHGLLLGLGLAGLLLLRRLGSHRNAGKERAESRELEQDQRGRRTNDYIATAMARQREMKQQ
jgi:hypothetical protein